MLPRPEGSLAGVTPPSAGALPWPRAIAPAFAAVGHLKLFKDVRHVDAHRLLGDEQARGDPPVGEALGQEFEDLAFARGQAG
jgi:hypothetical protein